MITRKNWQERIDVALKRSRIVALIGPRQCGKTTLARNFIGEDSPNYFDLEDPAHLTRLDEPMTVLAPRKGLIVIDEIQRRPDLFPILRVLVDRTNFAGKFLILISASGELLKQSSESLAGRIATLELRGFNLQELGAAAQPKHWLRGGYPRAYLAATAKDSFAWRKNFIQRLLERDLPQLGVRTPATRLWRFWRMLAHYHGQHWNAAEFAHAMGVAVSSVRRYLNLLTDAMMLRQLQPWHVNTGKRQVKSPKIYIRDSGLLHQLLGITSQQDLESHPKVGASWEGYAIEEVLSAIEPDDACFWATHQRAEVDLLLHKDGRTIGVECKRTDAPKLTRAMQIAMADLHLDQMLVIYPGNKQYDLSDKVEVLPLAALQNYAG